MRNLYAREIKLRVLTNQRYPQLRNRPDEESHLGRKLMFTSLYFKSSWRWLIRSVLHFLCSANCLKSVMWALFIRCRSLNSVHVVKWILFPEKKKKKPPWYPQRSDEPGLLDGWTRCRVWLQSSFNEVPFCGKYLFLLVDRKAASLFPKDTASISNATTRNPIWAKANCLICLLVHHYYIQF